MNKLQQSAGTHIPKFIYFLLIIGLGLFFLYELSGYPLLDNNEGLYAEIAREMLVTGQWVIPQANFVPYLEKPPLLYWLIATSYSVFGVNEFAARLVPAMAALGTCISVLWLLHRLRKPEAGIIAAIVLASTLGFILLGRTILFDMLLTLWLTLSLVNFYLWTTQKNAKFLYFAYICLGLAILTKGLAGLILIAGITIAFLGITRNWQGLIKLIFNPIGLLLLLLVTVPWHIIASLQEPAFAWEYFINEHVLRFLNQRIPHDYHNGPWHYYLPRVAIYLLPWTFLLALFFIKKDSLNPFYCWRQKFYQQTTLPLFLWLWFLVPLLFFSISSAKANYYMIVGIPPLALLLGLKLAHTSFRLLCYYFIGVILIVLVGLHYYLGILLQETDTTLALTNTLLWVLPGTALLGLMGAFICYLYNSKSIFIPIILIASLMILVVATVLTQKPKFSDQYSRIAAAQYLNKQTPRPVFFYQDFEDRFSTVLFYSGRRVHIIDSTSHDLYFGQRSQQAGNWFPTSAEFMERAQTEPVYLVTRLPKLPQMLHNMPNIDLCPIFINSRALVFSNQTHDCHEVYHGHPFYK